MLRKYLTDACNLSRAHKLAAKSEKISAATQALTQAVVPKDPEKA